MEPPPNQQVPPLPPGPTTVGYHPVLDHIRTLSIMHYVVGGLDCLGALFGLVYVAMGLVFLKMPELTQMAEAPAGRAPSPDMDIPSQIMGGVFTIIGLGITVIALTLGILTIISGRKLARLEGRQFSLVMAAVQCLQIPFGTTLGVFTLIVLSKREAVWFYDHPEQVARPPRNAPSSSSISEELT